MKIRILDRILVALAGLLMVAGGAALAAELFFGKNVSGRVAQWLADDNVRVYVIIAGILIIAIGVYCILLLFRHRGKNGKYIMQRTENGELAISLNALGSMVQKCLDQHQEVSAQAVELENDKGCLVVRIRGTLAGGISIPLTIETLQQQIKQYVTACSGVEVKDILVEIESSGPDAKDAPFAIAAPAAIGLLKEAGETPSELPAAESGENAESTETEQTETAHPETPAAENQATDELTAAAAAAAMLMDHAPAEEDDRPMHQRLFSTVEEPCVMPMPPKDLEEAKPSEETKPEETKVAESKTETVKTGDIKAEGEKAKDIKPETEKTIDVKAEEVKPEVKKPEEAKPEKTKAEAAKPVDVKPEEVKVKEAKTEDVKPADVKATDAKPADTKPEDVKAEEVKPEPAKPEVEAEEIKPGDGKAEAAKEEAEHTGKGKGFFSKRKSKQKNTTKGVPEGNEAGGVKD